MNRNVARYLPGLVAALTMVSTAAAQGQVTSIVIGDDRNDTTSTPVQPEGTSSVWVMFEYQGAGSSDFTVLVQSVGGVPVFTHSAEYSGNGRGAVEITGEEVFTRLSEQLVDYAEEASSNIEKVQSQDQVLQYASDLVSNVNQMDVMVRLMERVDDPAVRSDVQAARAAMDELTDLAHAISAAPSTDIETKKARARDMKPHVDDTMAAARRLAAINASELPWPTSPSVSESDAYNVQVKVNGSLSKAEPLWIFGATPGDPRTAVPQVGGTATTKSTGGTGSTAATATAKSALGVGTTAARGAEATAAVEAAASARIVARGGATATLLPGMPTLPPSGDMEGSQMTMGALPTPPPFGQTTSSQSGAEPQATWTLPASGAAQSEHPAESSDGAAPAEGGGSGPNVMILAVGLVALAAVALFLRGRM